MSSAAPSAKTRSTSTTETRSRATKGFVAEEVSAARSRDLVLAITGYLGSGMTSLAEQLKARLEKLPEHEGGVSSIKASGLLEAEARKRGEVIPNGSRYERTQWLQQFGDTLRAEHGTAVVAGLIIREMKAKRRSDANGQAFIIDCCKHPEEVAVLRDVYGSGFFLIGMICDLETRKTNLRRKFHGDATEEQIEEIIDTDAKEEMDWGQHARKTLPMADYFVSQQEGGALVSIDKQIERLLELVLGTAVHRPNRDERGMYAAWGAALRSSCLSRQVGAAIINQQGIVIATGTNDVPAPGGGIYPSNNSDARCHLPIEGPPGRDIAIGQKRSIELRVLGSKKTAAGNAPLPFCRNDFVKEALWVDVTEKLNKLIDSTSCPPLTKDAVKDALRQTLIRDLVEFSRALHAEADALISLARAGGPSCQGASLYVTLFPCCPLQRSNTCPVRCSLWFLGEKQVSRLQFERRIERFICCLRCDPYPPNSFPWGVFCVERRPWSASGITI